MNDLATRRFIGGLLLAWGPWVPTLIGLDYSLRGIWNGNATGMVALAGGLGESLLLWGLVSMTACQVVAIFWLVRSISREHWTRSGFAVVSACASAVILLLMGMFVWLAWFHQHL